MSSRIFRASVLAFFVALFGTLPARAGIEARVDVSNQRMTVVVDGVPTYDWAVSTGRGGFDTPRGAFRAKWLARMHYSRKYHWSPMPWSVFFHGGYAVHGTSEIGRLGRPASHGCVRLHPSNAATLFSLVRARGTGSARIVITD